MSSTASAGAKNNRSQIEYWGSIYTESFFSVVPFHFQSKHPIPHPTTHGWWSIADTNELQLVMQSHPRINLALEFTPACRVLAVECDGPADLEHARKLGISYRHNCWIRQSKRGPAFFYAKPREFNLPSFKCEDYPLELLSDSGLLLVPPSVHTTGFRYRWIRGPEHIGVFDLDEPPAPVLEEWTKLAAPRREYRGPSATITLCPALQANLRDLLLSYLPQDHHTHYNPYRNTITSYMEASQGKKHLSIDLTHGRYYDFHRSEGGPIADLLKRLGCPDAPRIYPRGATAGMEFPI
jgi:hypothetical protein